MIMPPTACRQRALHQEFKCFLADASLLKAQNLTAGAPTANFTLALSPHATCSAVLQGDTIMLVTEFMPRGDLYHALNASQQAGAWWRR